MALAYQSAGVANAASGASPTTIATTVALAVGDALVVSLAYDNSGGSGADSLSNFAAAPAAGAMTLVSAQTGLNDPGAASAGVCVRVNTYRVTSAIASGTNISISWSGTIVVRAAVLVRAYSNSGGIAAYRTNSGATGTNVVASAAPGLTTPSVTNGELVLCWAAHEYGANITGDADTTSGTWGSIVTTFNGSTTSGIAMGVQGKTVTATATQAFNPTGTSSDWIVGAVIFTELTGVSTTRATTWNVRARITTTRATTWNVAFTAMAKIATLVDSFDAAPISTTLWPDQNGVSWDTGRCKIPITQSYLGLQTKLSGAGTYYDLTGSAIFFKLVVPALGGSREFFMELRPPGADTNNRLFFRIGDSAPTVLEAQKVDGGSYSYVGGGTYSPTNHAWLRISESGGTLTYAASPDGTTWTTIGTTAVPSWSLAAVSVRMGGGHWDGGDPDGDAFIDNVNVAPVAAGPTVVAMTNAGGSGTTSVAVPAGGTTGDHYIIFIGHPDRSSTPPTFSSAGFTEIGTKQGADVGGGNWWWTCALVKPYSGTEGSSFAVSDMISWAYLDCVLVRGGGNFVRGAYSADSDGIFDCTGVTASSAGTLGLINTMTTNAAPDQTAAGWTLVGRGTFNAAQVFKKEGLAAGATGTVAVASSGGGYTCAFMVAVGVPVTTGVVTIVGTTTSSGDSDTVAKPSGVAIGDRILIQGGCDGTPISNALTSTGFTRLVHGDSGGGSVMEVLEKVADAGDVAASSYTASWASGSSARGLICTVLRGAEGTPTVGVMQSDQTAGPINIPTQTIATGGLELICSHGYAGFGEPAIPLAGWTTQAGPARTNVMFSQTTPGATGTVVVVLTGFCYWQGVSLLFAPAPTAPTQDATHPKLYYDFSGSGVTVTDMTGNGQTGSMFAGSTPVATDLRSSGQLLIDDANDYLKYLPIVGPTKASLTFKLRAAQVNGNCGLWVLARGSDSSGFNLFMQGDHLEFIGRDSNGDGSAKDVILSGAVGPTMVANTDYQIAVTYQSGAFKIYVDGTEVYTSSTLTGPLHLNSSGTADSGFRVGKNEFMTLPNGTYRFDDIRWWDDYTLTPAEVAAIGGGGLTPVSTSRATTWNVAAVPTAGIATSRTYANGDYIRVAHAPFTNLAYGTIAFVAKLGALPSDASATPFGLNNSGPSTAFNPYIWRRADGTTYTMAIALRDGSGIISDDDVPWPAPVTGTWRMVVMQKATGNVPAKYWVYDYTSGTWLVDGVSSAVNIHNADCSAIAEAHVGAAHWAGGWDTWVGDLAGVAVWENTVLNNTQVHTLASTTWTPWTTLTPNGLFILDQASTATPIASEGSEASAQTAINGTAVNPLSAPIGRVTAPTTFTDDFNRANGAVGSNWATLSGASLPVIVSNAIEPPAAATDTAMVTAAAAAVIQSVAIDAVLGADYSEVGVLLHAANTTSLLFCVYTTDGTHPDFPGFGNIDGPALQLYYGNGSTYIMIANVAAPGTGTHRLYGIALSSNQIEFWFDGKRMLSGTDGGAVARTGKPGITLHHATTPARADNASVWSGTALAAPTISLLTPSAAPPGATVTITGTGFVVDATQLPGADIPVTVTSPTSGTFVIPNFAPGSDYTASVQTPFGTSSSLPFTILPPGVWFGQTTEAASGAAAPHSSLTVDAPPGITGAADQRVWMWVMVAPPGSGDPGITPPAGFVAVSALQTDPLLVGSGVYIHTRWFQSTTDLSGSTTFPVTFDGSTYVSRIVCGTINNTAGAGAQASYASTAGASIALPSVTTIVANAAELVATMVDPGATVDTPSGFTALTVAGTPQTFIDSFSRVQATAGATPTPTITRTGTSSALLVAVQTWSPVSALTSVSTTRATTWRVLARVTPVSRSTTWNVAGAVTPVSAFRVVSWNVRASVTTARAATWAVLTPVTTSRATTWIVRAAITATRAATWHTRAGVTALRAATWNTLAAVTTPRLTTWNTRTTTALATATTWRVLVPVSGTVTRSTTWNVNTSVSTSRATTWNAVQGVLTSRAILWNTAGSLVSVATSRSTTWVVKASVTASRAALWNALATMATPATRSTTWNALATATTPRATTWHTRASVTSVRAASWSALASIPSSRATTWNSRALVTAVRPTTWNVFGALAFVSTSRSTTWGIRAFVSTNRAALWTVCTPVTPTSRSTTWAVLRTVTPTTRSTTWKVDARVTSSRAALWNVGGPIYFVQTSRGTTWHTLRAIPTGRTTTWVTLAQAMTMQTALWRVLRLVPATRVARWNVAAPISKVTTSRSTTWNVAPSAPMHDYLVLFPDTVMYLGEHLIKMLYQTDAVGHAVKIWPPSH